MTAAQESRRKDVERFFGVLQGRFRILRYEFHEWNDSDIIDILHACVIIHNMLVDFSRNGELQSEVDETGRSLTSEEIVEEFLIDVPDTISPSSQNTVSVSSEDWLQELMGVEDSIRDKKLHDYLRTALENHIWNLKGDQV